VWSGSARDRTSRWRSRGWPRHRRHGGPTPLMTSRWVRVRVRVRNTAAGLGGGVVPGGHRWRHRSPPATCRAGASRDRRAPRAQQAGPNGSLPTQLPASEWCCCHTPKWSPLTHPRALCPASGALGRAARPVQCSIVRPWTALNEATSCVEPRRPETPRQCHGHRQVRPAVALGSQSHVLDL
jgi:hypothetical protein